MKSPKKGEKAWHQLGNYVDEAMTAEQVIVGANLDFPVVKQPLYIDPTNPQEVPNYFATVRTDTNDVLGVVSEKYEILQNIEAFEFFDTVIDKGEAIFHTAGVLGKGEKIFVTAKFPEDIEVRGEQIENWFLLSTGHDGRTPTNCGFSSIAVVCENTLKAALKDLQNSVTILHYKNIKDKLKAAAKVMGIASKYSELLNESFNKMARVSITDQQLRDYIVKVMEPRKETINPVTLEKEYSTRFINQVDSIIEFAHDHETQQGIGRRNTVWGAYNAISGYYGWLKEYKTQEDKMSDLYFKIGGQKIEEAYAIAAQMI